MGLFEYFAEKRKKEIMNNQMPLSKHDITTALNHVNNDSVQKHEGEISYPKAAYYNDLESIAKEYNLSGKALKGAVEKGYHLIPTKKEVFQLNLLLGSVSLAAGYFLYPLDPPLLDSKGLDLALKSTAWTAFIDAAEYSLIKETKGSIYKTMADDLATFAGYFVGKFLRESRISEESPVVISQLMNLFEYIM